jgi:thymidylate synthase
MLMNLIEGATADEVWREAAERIRCREGVIHQPGRNGETIELIHTLLVISNPTDRWVLNRRPAINPAFALADVIWILSGRNDSGFVNFWNPHLPKYAGWGPVYCGAYGHRLRFRFGVDQIRYAFESLRAQPDSRQVVLQIWDAASDLPIYEGQPRNEDIPCNVCSLLKVREGRLEWTQIMRSNDLKIGWPYNVVQFTTMQEMMSAWLDLELGSYIHYSDSLHVYINEIDELAESPAIVPEPNTDRWELTYVQTMDVIIDMGRRMDAIRNSASDLRVIRKHGYHCYSSQAATNALTLICADAARRVQAVDLANELASRCTNPILRQLWHRWYDRRQLQEKDVARA